ncbi:unnamed protein product [Lupinus luteus]|uniref:pyruvate kinase n=1 Tax=Lupinus luteus TaxID=3873 RepID=A0AAV1XWX0_LUPLU
MSLRLFTAPPLTPYTTHTQTHTHFQSSKLSFHHNSLNSQLSISETNRARPGLSISHDLTSIDVDAVTETELKKNGFRSTRRTKLVCTIGPATCVFEELEALAVGGMNMVKNNMCHGTKEWHQIIIERVCRP